ncbi:MAG: hypothetical protein PHR61_04200 [Candidatus Absconditabacteria bacterium]|nr:hypothetical protein [Candidatus Absconditabacteria bacterium]
MNTITVEVPTKIAQKYGKKIVSYQELLELVEESFWTDFDVEPKIEIKDFLINFDKMKILYEKIDHIVATKELEKGETKSFTDVNELFNDLDN